MRKWIIIFLSFIVCGFSSINAASKEMVKIQHWKTTTGASVYFIPVTNLPILDLRIIFAAGSIYDEKKQGFSSVDQ